MLSGFQPIAGLHLTSLVYVNKRFIISFYSFQAVHQNGRYCLLILQGLNESQELEEFMIAIPPRGNTLSGSEFRTTQCYPWISENEVTV